MNNGQKPKDITEHEQKQRSAIAWYQEAAKKSKRWDWLAEQVWWSEQQQASQYSLPEKEKKCRTQR